MRENISDAQQDGANIKHDVAMAVSSVPVFIDEVLPLLHAAYDGVRPIEYGHLGGGNPRFNVSRRASWTTLAWRAETDRVNSIVLDRVARYCVCCKSATFVSTRCSNIRCCKIKHFFHRSHL